uniref:Uncharacterized protein n=1 Tax=Amphimedon queenslandica TaxID=400682 RepID=A0A1X7T6D4_AMPQE
MLEFWIKRGDYDVNVKDKRNRTPLFNAVKSGSIEAVHILLTNGARADVISKDCETLLHCASEFSKIEMLKFWIKRGDYDINVLNKKNRPPFFNAVKSGSIEAVDILLINGARTDIVDEDGVTLLHCAGESGKVEMLEFWINRGEYDVNAKDKSNRTPLFTAVKSGSIEVVDVLLTNGSRTDVVDKCCTTPLHFASETGNGNIIKLLITKGNADVNAIDENSRTPLFNAVESGSIEAVNILFANGARTDVASKDGETLLHCASKSGKVGMLEFCIKNGDRDVNVKNKDNETPLFNAVKSGSIEAVDILLTNGARTDVVCKVHFWDDCSTITPLHCASESGNAKIIELLITKGKADVNAVDKNNRTPLFNAVKSGSIEAVDILLTNGARTDVVPENGETLLHCASESGEVKMLKFWFNRGDYDVNVTDKYNRTPLFNAIHCCSIEVVDILLTNGARTDVMDKNYCGTPLLFASERGNAEIIESLITKGTADVNCVDKDNRTPLFNAVKSGSIEAVDILLTNGARTDVVSKDGETLLHCAGESGKVEMLEFWIKKGDYDVNVENKDNRTPLFNAVKSGSIEAVDILLTNGARTDVVSKDDSTPLHCASKSGNAKIIELIITKGKADVNAVDKDDRTPLFNAVKSGSIEAVDILLTNGAITDVVSKNGETLLHCAGESGKVEMLEFWIIKGDYDVNVKNKYDRTPLFNAVESGSIEAVDILLTNGARTDVVSKSWLANFFSLGSTELASNTWLMVEYGVTDKDSGSSTDLKIV